MAEARSRALFGTGAPPPPQPADGSRIDIREVLGPLNEVEQKNAPRHLHLAGDRSLLSRGRRISVVGSRRASRDEQERAYLLTKEIVDRGITVLSGLAEGIDTVAHETAVECGGRTVAVLGTGLSEVYPKSNEALQHRIMKEHLAVSQFDDGAPVKPGNFVRRNRTMALLCDATLIVAAGPGSGTRHQGWEAIRLGRDLAILKPLAENPAEWTLEQIRYGAEPLSLNEVGYWLDAVPERTHIDGLVL